MPGIFNSSTMKSTQASGKIVLSVYDTKIAVSSFSFQLTQTGFEISPLTQHPVWVTGYTVGCNEPGIY